MTNETLDIANKLDDLLCRQKRILGKFEHVINYSESINGITFDDCGQGWIDVRMFDSTAITDMMKMFAQNLALIAQREIKENEDKLAAL